LKHYPNETLYSETLELRSQIFLGFAEFLLKSPQQFIVFAFGTREIVIAQLRIFLFQFPFYFVPTAFEFQFRHSDREFACGAEISFSKITWHRGNQTTAVLRIRRDIAFAASG